MQALHLLLICIVPFSGALPLRLAPTALLFQCVLRQLVLAAGGLGGAGVRSGALLRLFRLSVGGFVAALRACVSADFCRPWIKPFLR